MLAKKSEGRDLQRGFVRQRGALKQILCVVPAHCRGGLGLGDL